MGKSESSEFWFCTIEKEIRFFLRFMENRRFVVIRPCTKLPKKNRSRFVPVITADCKLEEKYRFDLSLGPLKCPLLVFHGTKERDGYCIFFLEGKLLCLEWEFKNEAQLKGLSKL